MGDRVTRFISILVDWGSRRNVFNPWVDVDRENDIGAEAPVIRRRHLEHYFRTRQKNAQCVIIGEAIGYQGGHFSGIAMTSERILLGFQRDRGIYPEHVLPNLAPSRTSKPDIKPSGFAEPTATIVWSTLLGLDPDPTVFVLWNAFPFHPFNPKKGMLSNRKPNAGEIESGLDVLREFLNQAFRKRKVVAMGKVAENCLKRVRIPCHPVRHPAQGGAPEFRRQLMELRESDKG